MDFEKANIRQLFYEASAISIAELKQRVERVESSSEPATLPLAERIHRSEAQKLRLTGVHFSVHSEPSNKLVDQYFQMISDQQLLWLPWQKLASRNEELQMSKRDMHFVFDGQGNLKMTKKETEAMSDLKGEIQVRQALTSQVSSHFRNMRSGMNVCLNQCQNNRLQVIVRQRLSNARRRTNGCGPNYRKQHVVMSKSKQEELVQLKFSSSS